MLPLAASALQVVETIGLGAAGFVVVALVCIGVLAMLQLILPSEDSGAAAAEASAEADDESGLDTEGDA